MNRRALAVTVLGLCACGEKPLELDHSSFNIRAEVRLSAAVQALFPVTVLYSLRADEGTAAADLMCGTGPWSFTATTGIVASSLPLTRSATFPTAPNYRVLIVATQRSYQELESAQTNQFLPVAGDFIGYSDTVTLTDCGEFEFGPCYAGQLYDVVINVDEAFAGCP